MTFHVDSEVGQLRQVIVHRPGLELPRLTPDNVEELLFDDVMWPTVPAQSTMPSSLSFVAAGWLCTTFTTCSPRPSTNREPGSSCRRG